ncbi:MAG: four helix bundle protein [Flavobacteriia bacterium]|jgi:four helix bundle protein
MGKIKSFEDLEVWQLSMSLCTEIYELTNTDLFSKDFGLKEQIRRSAISIPSNISEGFERDSKNQFLYFLSISKGSCGELRTQLNIAFNLNYLEKKKFEELKKKCIETSKQLSGFSKYLKKFENK